MCKVSSLKINGLGEVRELRDNLSFRTEIFERSEKKM